MIDADKAGPRCNRMWWKLGTLLEKAAYDKVERGLHNGAMECARMAEVCFWQATGEMDAPTLKEVLSKGAE